MLYYKVKESYDNETVYTNRRPVFFLVGNELYTEKEYQKIIARKPIFRHGSFSDAFEPVYVKKTSVYFMFGARFSDTV